MNTTPLMYMYIILKELMSIILYGIKVATGTELPVQRVDWRPAEQATSDVCPVASQVDRGSSRGSSSSPCAALQTTSAMWWRAAAGVLLSCPASSDVEARSCVRGLRRQRRQSVPALRTTAASPARWIDRRRTCRVMLDRSHRIRRQTRKQSAVHERDSWRYGCCYRQRGTAQHTGRRICTPEVIRDSLGV